MFPRHMALFLALAFLAPASASAQRGGPVAQWVFARDQLVGGSFRASAGELPLRPLGPTKFIGEGTGESLVLSKESGYLVADEAAVPGSLPRQRITLEAWVAVDVRRPWAGIVSAIEDNGDHERGWLLGCQGENFVFAIASEGAERFTYLKSRTIHVSGRWYHVLGTYDGELMRLWIDGRLEAESDLQQGRIRYDDTHQFVVGTYKDKDEDHRLVGCLNEVRVYDRALVERDIKSRYNKKKGKLALPDGKTFTSIEEVKRRPLPELQPAINDAIDRGVDHLLRQQRRDGSWGDAAGAYRNGQTALSIYTLLKSGLGPGHPAIVRGLAFLRERPPTKTYSAACQLLALAATGDEAHVEWARGIVDDLVEWENRAQRGGWGYPGGTVDLSNTQFAALGLWAGHRMGIATPAALWERMVDGTIEHHRTRIEELAWGDTAKARRTGTKKIAGFTYRGPGENAVAMGSMTAAGICVLALAKECAGDALKGRVQREVDNGIQMALGWFENYYTVERNVGRNGYYYYYLYGFERVGALLDIEMIGDNPWYRDGAEMLIKKQKPEGNWDGEPQTCFALLFLQRATAAAKSGREAKRVTSAYHSDEGEVHLRATGSDRFVVWVEGFDPELLEEYIVEDPKRTGMRVLKVEYLADGEVFATIEADPKQRWSNDRYPTRHSFDERGPHVLQARVTVLPPDTDPAFRNDTETLLSAELEVVAALSAEDWMRRNVEAMGDKNLVLESRPRVTASSALDDNHAAAKAVDGYQSTRWLCKKDETVPWIELAFDRPIRANTIVLSPPASKLGEDGNYDRIVRVEVVVDGDDPTVVELERDDLFQSVVTLPKTVRMRTLTIRVLERVPGKQAGTAGFAEIAIEKR